MCRDHDNMVCNSVLVNNNQKIFYIPANKVTVEEGVNYCLVLSG